MQGASATPAAKWEGLILIQGPGIDDYIDYAERVIILDEFYTEMYADYVFLGPQVYAESINTDYPDLVGLINVDALLEPGKTLIVCGDDPRPCISLVAAKLLAAKPELGAIRAVQEAWSIVRRAYQDPRYRPNPEALVYPGTHLDLVEAYASLYNQLGKKLYLIASLAMNYDYGLGRRFYGELVTWSHAARAPRGTRAASLFSFLAHSRYGKPLEILKYRLSVATLEDLRRVFGELGEEAVNVLQRFASNRYDDEDTAVYMLLASLQPGQGIVLHVKRHNEKLHVYCSVEANAPSRKCIESVKDTLEKISDKLPEWARSPQIRVGPPEPLRLPPP